MKALAKVYPLLGSIRFLIVLPAVLMLSFAAHLWMNSSSNAKSPIQLRCCNNNQVSFTAANASHTLPMSESLEVHPFDFEGVRWGVAAVKAVYISDVIADLVERNRTQKEPLLGLIQDAQDKEYVVLISRDGELTVSSVAWLLKNTSAPFDQAIVVKASNECIPFYFKTWLSTGPQ